MSHDKNDPKQIESEFVSKASDELEESVAEEPSTEDPSPEEAAAAIEKLTVQQDSEAE